MVVRRFPLGRCRSGCDSVTRSLSLLLAVAVGLSAGQRAQAADLEWSQTTGPLFFYDTAANWAPSQTPTLADNVTFAVDVSGNPIIIGASSQAQNVSITDNDWEFTGAAGGVLDSDGVTTIDDPFGTSLASGTNLAVTNNLTWNNAGNILVGDTGYGSLTIQDGSNVDGLQIFVGNTATGVGEITLTGAETSLTARFLSNTGVHTIGRGGGTGTINVLDGARLDTNSSGANDIWVGGHLDDAATEATTSTGTLNVDGVGSFVETEDLNVGIAGGMGFLNITGGGVVNTADGNSADTQFGANTGFDGLQSVGTGVVDGDGSLLQSRAILVGGSGVGSLAVSNGGRARTQVSATLPGDAHIGLNAGSEGRAAVYGFATDGTTASLLDVDDSLFVGNAGIGQLNIGLDLDDNEAGSGALQVDIDLLIGDDAGNNLDNAVVISGVDATANIGRSITAGNSGSGYFEARNGATVTIGLGLNVGLLGGADGTALVDGVGTTVTANRLFIGNGTGSGSTGEMTVSGGAVATFTGAIDGGSDAITLGDDDEGVGTLTVTGAGSVVETTNASGGWFIGGSNNENNGTGTANIVAGGHGVSAARVVVAHGVGSVGNLRVDGTGSVFDANGDFILVGFRGVGNMDVTNGGLVNANNVFVADVSSSTGSQLDIDGAGSVVNIDGLLHVGDSARGIVNVTDGGQLNVATGNGADRLIIGDESPTDASRLTISGDGSRVDYFGTDRVSVGFVGGGSFNDPVILEVLDGAVLDMEHEGTNTSIGLFVADEASSAGLVTVDGGGSRIHTRRMLVSDSNGSQGTVNVTGGGVIEVDEFVEIGSNGNGDGFLTVSGAGSRLDAGGDLSVAFGSSSVRVDGTMTIADGGAVTTGDQGFIGRASTNVGTVHVGGAGALATWDIGTDLFIAGSDNLAISGSQTSGSATLNVMDNGRVTVSNLLVLKDRGVINLDGGELAANDILFQDFAERALSPTFNFNSGTLRYSDPQGKTLDAASIDTIFGGSATLASGQHLAVDGVAELDADLRLDGGTLSVGSITPASFANVDFDAGTLNLTNSDLIVISGGLFGDAMTIALPQTVNVSPNPDGNAGAEVIVTNDATLTVVGGLSADTIINDGDVVLVDTTGSGRVLDAAVVNNEGSTLTLVGDTTFTSGVSGPGDVYGPGSAIFAGGLSPGNSPGIVEFESGFELTSSNSLLIELAGTEIGDFDRLVAGGDVVLDGILDVELIEEFEPQAGQTFDILDWGTLSGTFSQVNLPLLSNSLTWDTTELYTDGILAVIGGAGLLGDYNGDGRVDAADYTVWRDSEGATGSGLAADGNGDLVVDQADYGVWRANFGRTSASLLGSDNNGAVPEPTTLALAGLAAVALALQRRKFRRV